MHFALLEVAQLQRVHHFFKASKGLLSESKTIPGNNWTSHCFLHMFDMDAGLSLNFVASLLLSKTLLD